MTEQPQDEQQAPRSSGLGLELRRGREAKGYTVERIADELHLRPSIVIAMEEENYKLLPGDIFLKGYIRSYARLVGLSEDKVVQLLDLHLNREEELKAQTKQVKGKEKRKKHSKYAVLILLIAIVLGVLLYFWSEKLGNGKTSQVDEGVNAPEPRLLSDSSSTSKEIEVAAAETVEETPQSGRVETATDAEMLENESPEAEGISDHSGELEGGTAEPVSSEAKPVLPAPSIVAKPEVSPLDEAPVATAPVETESTETESTETVAIETAPIETAPIETAPIENTASIETAPAETVTNAAPSSASEVGGTDTLNQPSAITAAAVQAGAEPASTDSAFLEQGTVKAVFSGECWFTLKNGLGKTVIADLKTSGEEINYSGPLPFSIVVGAVSEVTMHFDDTPIDFSTVRVRNNRASLELTH
ncbi:RodZ domain-containing protein [Alkalimarinus sediminis]|uniref:DUF4115 domain-containing protein n=1 Tax=Alkalimarinus sediminis TaxID=1632866 RepID=A0A9E8HM70_9ALTE|nr:RodZ domain-containing protein [Alkalimarinus sediminis]UZW75897.1 DUF4115 domain-containing protein [Alkalimarinus sediminis]